MVEFIPLGNDYNVSLNGQFNPNLDTSNLSDVDTSIFNSASDSSSNLLEAQLSSAKEDQGVIQNKWDDLKCALNVGANSEKCDDIIEKYKSGEVSFEEASAEIDKFKQKQDGSLDLFSNIVTGVASVVVASATAGKIAPKFGKATPKILSAIGAGTGAATKASFKTLDRATNNIEGDALDGKKIAKDALQGAITGGIGASTIGNGKKGNTMKESVVNSAKGSMKTGVITGAISGSSNYVIDTAFDEDKQFNAKDFVVSTASNAAIGSVVGGIMGSANGAMRYSEIIKNGGNIFKDGVVTNVSAADCAANALCNAEYKIVNKGVRSVAA